MSLCHSPASQPERTIAEFPLPTAAAMEHSQQLIQHIASEIAQHGPISFAHYMELALYAPGLGYYTAGSRKFGGAGDFITAPELSPLFSQALAWQCAEILGALNGGEILEFGAGSGAMAVELLLELERLGRLPGRYLILDLSPSLRARQRQRFEQQAPHLIDRIGWLDRLPERFTGVVLGNELLDAMPVERFQIGDSGGIEAAHVDWQEGRFVDAYQPADEPLRNAIRAIESGLGETLPVGYRSEVNLNLAPWFEALSGSLQRAMVILIDYGYPRREYYLPERSEGTLMCHYRHRAHSDPFFYPGLQDITSYVDFSAATEAALAAGFELAGYTSQANFLIGCGLDELFARTLNPDEGALSQDQLELARQIKLLTLPGEMGERFKTLALSLGLDLPLRGFSLRDMRDRL